MILLEATAHSQPVWENAFFYLFVGTFVVFMSLFFTLLMVLRKRVLDQKLLQQQHVARVDIIRKEHSEKLENIRIEMLKREEDRSRQWIESEKETLHVLNGVSNLLELSDKVDKIEFNKINKILIAINEKIVN